MATGLPRCARNDRRASAAVAAFGAWDCYGDGIAALRSQ